MDWGKQNDARTGRIQKYNDNLAIDDKEVWHEVKRYYKELEEYAHDKKDKEKALTDRLVAYYNAASGAKAEEIRKRAEEHFRSIEDGQVLNAAVLEKLDQRVEKVAVDKEKKAHAVREINTVAEQVKYGVYEHDEQKAYDVLQKNYENDKRAVKAAKTHAD